ncbi:MAG: DNA polymerase III subunit gamma/tau [Terriglobales bacterium]
MAPVIARRYRPQTFDQVIGQDPIVRTLRNAIASGRVAHGFIFSGHRGIGKTTMARILAMALNCRAAAAPTPAPCGECEACREIRDGNAVDVIEIDAASNRGIDEIRALRERVRYRPARDRFKIFILDEAHQLTADAFNALLKTLEEPPEWAVFVLATTEPEALPPTIRSRCQHFAFRAVVFSGLRDHLAAICLQEQVTAEPEALELIAEAGEGSVRDALSLLEQAITHNGSVITAESVRSLLGRVSSLQIRDLLLQVAADSARGAFELADRLLAGVSPAQLCWQLSQLVRDALLTQTAPDLLETTEGERTAAAAVAASFRAEDLARFLQILLRCSADLRFGQQERLHFELALVKLLHARRLSGIEDVLAALDGGAAAAAPNPPPATALPMPPPTPPAALDPTASVLRKLEELGKAALRSIVEPAQWQWSPGRLELAFTGQHAGLASLADQPATRRDLAAACLAALGRGIEIAVVARPGGPAASSLPAPLLPGSPEERADQHPVLRQIKERIPSHILRTRALEDRP